MKDIQRIVSTIGELERNELKDFNDNLGKITKYWIENIDWSTLE